MQSNQNLVLELGPNEFTDKTDRFGLFSSSEPDSHNFLSVEREERQVNERQTSPKISIKLSPIKHEYERSAFTLMMVLGELGGIYGAIVSIPSLFISYFVQNLFMSAVTDLMPAKQKSRPYQENPIIEKLAKKDPESQCDGRLVLEA